MSKKTGKTVIETAQELVLKSHLPKMNIGVGTGVSAGVGKKYEPHLFEVQKKMGGSGLETGTDLGKLAQGHDRMEYEGVIIRDRMWKDSVSNLKKIKILYRLTDRK